MTTPTRLRFRAALLGWTLATSALSLTACQSLMGPPVYPPRSPQPSEPGTPQPQPGTPQPQTPTPTPPPPTPSQPPKQFRLSAASSALVSQARTQSGKGDFAGATATVERALRIEPDNPLLWIELGRARLTENNPVQADAMGRKALALGAGDPRAQASAWHLIAEAQRAQGHNQEAVEAERRALGLTPR